eukprot:CAMPEP_0113880202 /NCGR_PEP_ID=MMETSP0780_2-20120614/7655_1 /TAXON_ID=652834 /ORGANISM="Palpitomonas bilix" /LENGTH=110 /DNA_ID=CAMNT_0000866853 /DNA_START=161 /DNA_END=493 /DNA_ORIENTATION=- /assembly_acc=CAM_ASM_000599
MSWKAALSSTVRELRFNFCPKGESSTGVRNFVEGNYHVLRHLNPATALLIRNAPGIEPRITACYDFGKEEMVSVSDMSSEDIEKTIQHLVKKGMSMPVSGEREIFTAWTI